MGGGLPAIRLSPSRRRPCVTCCSIRRATRPRHAAASRPARQRGPHAAGRGGLRRPGGSRQVDGRRGGWPVGLVGDGRRLPDRRGDGRRRRAGRAELSGARRWRDSLRALYAGPRPRGRRVAGDSRKQRLDAALAGFTFCATRAPLVRLYLLDTRRRAQTPLVEPLSAREGLIALLRFTFHLDVEDCPAVADRFDRAARVAGAVAARRLCLPDRLEVGRAHSRDRGG